MKQVLQQEFTSRSRCLLQYLGLKSIGRKAVLQRGAYCRWIILILAGYLVSETMSPAVSFSGLGVDPDGTVTTVCETLEPKLNDDGSPSDALEPHPGEPHILRNDLGAPALAGLEQLSLAYFYVFTDIHVTDEEAPSRLNFFDSLIDAAWRPHEDIAQHVLNAIISTGNSIMETYNRDFTFVMALGDNVDNAELIEHMLFLQTMKGGTVNPDTGDPGRFFGDQDPYISFDSNSNDVFEAAGVKEGVSSYAIIGNHDVLWAGNFIGNDKLFTGDSSPFGFLAADNPNFDFSQLPVPVAPDSNRHYMEHAEVVVLMQEQGLILENDLEEVVGCYSFMDQNGMPLRYIVLDTEDGRPLLFAGTIRQQQFNWLRVQLEEAEEEHQLVVVFSHHGELSIISNNVSFVPTWDLERFPELHPLWKPAPDGKDIECLLSGYPNVIMHMAGHSHDNRVRSHPSPVAEEPERGFWEVQTASLIDFPQQARIAEVVLNRTRDGDIESGSIYLTMANHESAPGSITDRSRNSSWVDVKKKGWELDDDGRIIGTGRGAADDRNVILQFALSQEMKDYLGSFALAPDLDEEVTTESFYENCRGW